MILAAPAHAAARLLAPIDQRGGGAVRAGAVRLDRQRRARLAARSVAHPLAGTRLRRRAAPATLRDHRVHVGLVEVGRARARGHVLLRAFLGGAHDPDAVDLLGRRRSIASSRAISPACSASPGAPSLARVHRWRDAGAQHLVGHLARVDAIERASPRHGGLFVAGSGFRAIGIPDCVADGRAAAAAAAAVRCKQSRRTQVRSKSLGSAQPASN